MTRNFLILAAALVLSSSAGAQTSVPNTFTANTPANAEDVNANFGALVTAINALDTRVTALEAGGGGGGALTMADVAGTWQVHSLETEHAARDDAGASILGSYLIDSTVTLNANGTFSISDTDNGVRVLTTVFKGPCDPAVPEGAACVYDNIINDVVEGGTDSDTGTWTLSGQIITLTFSGSPPETQDLMVSADGNMLVTTFVEDEAIPDGGSTMRLRLLSLAIGIKTAPAP
jgi:hypothetical protein